LGCGVWGVGSGVWGVGCPLPKRRPISLWNVVETQVTVQAPHPTPHTPHPNPYLRGLNQPGAAGGAQLRCIPVPLRKARRMRPAWMAD